MAPNMRAADKYVSIPALKDSVGRSFYLKADLPFLSFAEQDGWRTSQADRHREGSREGPKRIARRPRCLQCRQEEEVSLDTSSLASLHDPASSIVRDT
jgi:hypothetical protein